MSWGIPVTEERWRSVALKDIATDDKYGVVGGPFGSKLVSRDYVPEGVPVLRGANLPLDREIALDDLVFVTDEKVKKDLFGNLAHPGDIVVTQRGTLGQIGLLPDAAESPYDRYVVSQSQMKLTVDPEKASNRFVYYALRSPGSVKRIQDLGMSSGVPHINLDIFRNFEIRLPNLPVQRVIANWLRSFDDLIENNRRRIKILEDMARLIYREWFVHLRFPGHENVALVDSDLGPLPAGWEKTPIGSVLSFHIGGGWGQEHPTEDESAPAAVIRGTDIPRVRDLVLSSVPTRHHKRRAMDQRLLRPGDLVMEVSGGSKGQPVGRTLLVTDRILSELGGSVICASFCKLLRLSDRLAPEIAYSALRDLYDSGLINRYQVQSTGISNLKFKPFLEQFLVFIPAPPVQDAFLNLVGPLVRLGQTLGLQNRVLREARNLLLPRLISGELDVSNLDLDLEPVA